MAWTDWLMASGGGLIALAALILWRTSRYDLKGAALESAWQTARGRRTADNPTAIDVKLRDIQAEATMTGKARKTATTVAGHLVAQALGLASIAMLVLGAVLLGAGFYLR